MNKKYETFTLEDLGILEDAAYNPNIYEPVDETADRDSLHREIDSMAEPEYLDTGVRFYNKGDKVLISHNCSLGTKPIAGMTMYVTEAIYGDKPYEDCYKVSDEPKSNVFWVICHSDIEGVWKKDYRPKQTIYDRDGDNPECPVMDNTAHTLDEIGKMTINPPKPECIHKIELKSFKCEFVTYCTRCGKIFSSRKKRK